VAVESLPPEKETMLITPSSLLHALLCVSPF